MESGRASLEAAGQQGAQQPQQVAFYCAACRARLVISNASDGDRPGLFDSSRIDESFIVLNTQQGGPQSGPGPPRGLEESFVLLPQRTSNQALGAGRAPLGGSPPGQSQGAGDAAAAPAGLDAKLHALSQLFELASCSMQVDHPLCLDCASQLKDEIEAQIQEADQEIASYAAAAAALEATQQAALPEADFEQEMNRLKAAQEEQRQLARQSESELESARRDLYALQAVSRDLDDLEDKYWLFQKEAGYMQSYNDFQLVLRSHVEERDALVSRINYVNQRKQLLQATNVYNDAFKIWHDGPFATISGFRLGRTAEVPVEWDEINAAWGQAVLLLHTMAQNCGITFQSARLIPMGSHPRVADKRATYDLFGPVSKLWSSNYDRAMIGYLSCLREFGEYAEAIDRQLTGTDRSFYGFPFAIEGDKVNGHTIKLTLNKDAKWTKALKFMLANLKKALQWMVKYEAVRREMEAQNKMAALQPEPASLHH